MRRQRDVRQEWYGLVIQTTTVNAMCKILLMHVVVTHMEPGGRIGKMNDAGRFEAPKQKQLAEELAWPEKRVNERYAEAVRAGLLKRVSGGYNGCPTVYMAVMPVDDKGPHSVGTFLKANGFKVTGEEVPAEWGPSRGRGKAKGPHSVGYIRARVTETDDYGTDPWSLCTLEDSSSMAPSLTERSGVREAVGGLGAPARPPTPQPKPSLTPRGHNDDRRQR